MLFIQKCIINISWQTLQIDYWNLKQLLLNQQCFKLCIHCNYLLYSDQILWSYLIRSFIRLLTSTHLPNLPLQELPTSTKHIYSPNYNFRPISSYFLLFQNPMQKSLSESGRCCRVKCQWHIQAVWEPGIPVCAPKLWRPKKVF